ncbi:MAG: hypothetical protein ABL921_23240 [Pirellula sp.]
MDCRPKHRRASPHRMVLAAAAGVMLVTPPCPLVVSAQTMLAVTGEPETKVGSGRHPFPSYAGNEMQTGVASVATDSQSWGGYWWFSAIAIVAVSYSVLRLFLTNTKRQKGERSQNPAEQDDFSWLESR